MVILVLQCSEDSVRPSARIALRHGQHLREEGGVDVGVRPRCEDEGLQALAQETALSAQDEARARATILRHEDQRTSLADALTSAVMERLRLSQALSLKRNFVQCSWVVLGVENEGAPTIRG